jgi:hypothetical protein
MLRRPWWKREVSLIPRFVYRRWPWIPFVVVLILWLSFPLLSWIDIFRKWNKTSQAQLISAIGWTISGGIMVGLMCYLWLARHRHKTIIRRRWQRRCLHCGYLLAALPTTRCPECGEDSAKTARQK